MPSKRDIFLSTYRHQNFSFPNALMHYIAKNPKKSHVYEKKAIKCCKYFFIKNPLLVISKLSYTDKQWIIGDGKNAKCIDLDKMMAKLWLTGTLSVCPAGESHVASSLVPKIYKGGIERPDVTLSDQIMNADDFIVLCSKVYYLDLDFVTVNDGDGNPVFFKWLLEHQTPCDHFTYRFRTSFHNTSKADFKELWKIPHLCYYGTLYLVDVPKEFDIDSLLSFLKQYKPNTIHSWPAIKLYFNYQISEEYKARLETIVDEVLEKEKNRGGSCSFRNHTCPAPFIYFHGLPMEKYNKLNEIVGG